MVRTPSRVRRIDHCSKINLWDELLSIKLNAKQDISDLEFRLQLIVDNLTQLQANVDESLQIAAFCRALPSEFQPIITVLYAHSDLSLQKTIQIVKDFKENHYVNQKHTALSTSIVPEHKSKNFQRINFQRIKAPNNCSICGDSHHIRNCPLPCAFCHKTNHKSPRCEQRPSGIACFRCGGPHISVKCIVPPMKILKKFKKNSTSVYNVSAADEWAFCSVHSKDLNQSGAPKDSWLIDSGCTSHFCSRRSMFSNLVQSTTNIKMAGEDSFLSSQGKGTIKPFGDVLFVPKFSHNLLSVSALHDSNFKAQIRFNL